ncbi:MAG: sugar phosphate isomerase/epimerase [Pirellulaceae bacterium]|nr:sugar phosphate isomerase/epimerase [Pirellulaceae bacterium]
MNRRELLRMAAASGLATVATSSSAQQSASETIPETCIYTEQFQSLPIREVCRIFKQIGVDGLDLTVRPGGHIEPQDAEHRLPEASKTARDHGLRIMMLTTGITAADQHAESILATCQKLDIRRIKMGYYAVGEFGQLAKRLDDVRRQLDAVAKLGAKYEVRPCVHVHSGATIPSNGFMLYNLLRDLPPDRIGAYLDSYHMTITGGAGGWRQAIDLLQPWISLVALKNFQWHKSDRDKTGQQRWNSRYCRLQDGIAPIPEFVHTIHQAGYRGFYTLHTEYKLPVKQCIQLTTDDFAFLKRILNRL